MQQSMNLNKAIAQEIYTLKAMIEKKRKKLAKEEDRLERKTVVYKNNLKKGKEQLKQESKKFQHAIE